MMSVLEYANDVDKSIEYVFDLCKRLNIDANQEDDMLSDEDIILLDNEIQNDIDEDTEIDNFDENEFEDSYEEELSIVNEKANTKKKYNYSEVLVRKSLHHQLKNIA